MEHLGLIYRGILNRCALFVSDQRVEPVDPLFLDPNARFYDAGNDVSAQGREPLQFAMKNGRTGQEGMVHLRFSYRPPEFQRNKDGSENKERLGVMKDNNAYLIVTRAGRQIDLVMRSHYPKDELNKKNLHIFDRNWAVELDFDPELDDEFGITVNKQQVNLSDRAWQTLMDNNLPGIIKNDLVAPFIRARDEQKAKVGTDAPTQSEQVMAEAERFTKKRTPVPESKKEQARQKVGGEAEKRAQEAEKPKEEVEKKLLEHAQTRRYAILFEPLSGAPFYRPEWFGPEKRIWINTRHRFYSDVYLATESSPRVRAALEMMLCALSDSELHTCGDVEHVLRGERVEWSNLLETALRLYGRRFHEELEADSARS